MDNKAETLARVYALILSTDWGSNNPLENQNAGPSADDDKDRLLTERIGKSRSIKIVPEQASELGEK